MIRRHMMRAYDGKGNIIEGNMLGENMVEGIYYGGGAM